LDRVILKNGKLFTKDLINIVDEYTNPKFNVVIEEINGIYNDALMLLYCNYRYLEKNEDIEAFHYLFKLRYIS